MKMKGILKKTGFIVIGLFIISNAFSDTLYADELLTGRQFLVVGLSTGDIPFYEDVFSFGENGSFSMKKMSSYGSGEFYELQSGLFYIYFTTRPGVDIQSVAAFGVCNNSFVFGAGYFMIDYEIKPTVFAGVEVIQE